MRTWLLPIVFVFVGFTGSIIESACHTMPVHDVIDCAKQDQGRLVMEGEKLLALIPDWSAIYSTAVSDVAVVGWQIAGCVIADLTQQYLTHRGPVLTDKESWTAHDTLEKFRSTYAHGAGFKLPAGEL